MSGSAAPPDAAEYGQQCATQLQHFIIYCQVYDLLLAALIEYDESLAVEDKNKGREEVSL